MDDREYALSNRRLPGPVFRTVAWCRVWDILEVKQFSIPAVERGNLIGLTILLAGCGAIVGYPVEMRFSVVFIFRVSF